MGTFHTHRNTHRISNEDHQGEIDESNSPFFRYVCVHVLVCVSVCASVAPTSVYCRYCDKEPSSPFDSHPLPSHNRGSTDAHWAYCCWHVTVEMTPFISITTLEKKDFRQRALKGLEFSHTYMHIQAIWSNSCSKSYLHTIGSTICILEVCYLKKKRCTMCILKVWSSLKVCSV